MIDLSSSTKSSNLDFTERPRPSEQALEMVLVVDRMAGQKGPPCRRNAESPYENDSEVLDCDCAAKGSVSHDVTAFAVWTQLVELDVQSYC